MGFVLEQAATATIHHLMMTQILLFPLLTTMKIYVRPLLMMMMMMMMMMWWWW